MQTKLTPYLNFKNNTREVMEFYQSVFGGDLVLTPFSDYDPSLSAVEGSRIMHSELKTPGGLNIMASDTPDGSDVQPSTNISLSLNGDNLEEMSVLFEKLAASGAITEPLVMAPWGDTFGMCIDKYGINWLVNIAGQPA